MALLTKLLIKWRYRTIEPYVQGKVLDIGCGDGGVYELFSNKIQLYCGVDYHPHRIKSSDARVGNGKFYYQAREIEPEGIRG